MNDSRPSLHQLLQRTDLWRAREGRRHADPGTRPTGFADLDAALHRGGWPAAGLTELLCHTPCPQALRLLLPALAGLSEGLVMLAGPPARPCLNTLRRAGLDPRRLLIIRGRDPATLLRACREAAASRSVAALVAWLPRGLDTPTNLRRLHLAANQGDCLLALMRDASALEQPSPAPLRLLLEPRLPGDLHVHIHKQPGGWAGQQLQVPVLPEHLRLPMAPVAEMTTLRPTAIGGQERARVYRLPAPRTRREPINDTVAGP